VTSLHQKLNQLSLTTMSRQLDQMLAEAAAKSLSIAQTLESLADRELDARQFALRRETLPSARRVRR